MTEYYNVPQNKKFPLVSDVFKGNINVLDQTNLIIYQKDPFMALMIEEWLVCTNHYLSLV